jgi:thioredoxin reductase (NADPH)
LPIVEQRRAQMFPKLAPAEIDRLRHFGEIRRYRTDEALFRAGEHSPGLIIVIAGHVAITQRDPFGRVQPIVVHGPGDFSAEIAQLSGRPSLVDATAVDEVEALVVPTEGLRAILIAEAQVGERIMRALILRRVALIEQGTGGPVLIGAADCLEIAALQNFLTRNGHPHQVIDPANDPDAAALVERYTGSTKDLPLVVCPNGTVLKNPSEGELARALAMTRPDRPDRTYDVAIVGAGPAGLATAVYAASEGLTVIVFDRRAFGGQAGASSRIENYLGFPTGISGQALAGRAFVQAQKFGAEIMIPTAALRLDCGQHPYALQADDGRPVRANAVVVASGASYRRPDIANLGAFEGRGIWFWASPIEASVCKNEEVVLVGGGNSAGQAAVFLAEYASKVWMMVRGPSLAATMSRYLIDRIEANPRIELLTRTELVALSGCPEARLARMRWRSNRTGEVTEKPIRNLFLFIGADPATEWLAGCGVAVDKKGFVLTGREDLSAGSFTGVEREPTALETSVPGVFAVGDVRSGSVKRVGAAIGEGASVVAQLHAYLERTRRNEPAPAATS